MKNENWFWQSLEAPNKWTNARARKIYVLTFPIAIPLHLLWIILFIIIMCIFLISFIPLKFLMDIWEGKDEWSIK